MSVICTLSCIIILLFVIMNTCELVCVISHMSERVCVMLNLCVNVQELGEKKWVALTHSLSL